MLLLLLLFSVAFIVWASTYLKLHPFLALLAASLIFGLGAGLPFPVLIQAINEGFGNTLGKIGLVIIIGVIIGAFLEHSGGVFALAENILKIIGKQRVPWAMALIGYIVSIPVFADSGLIILTPLNKALTKRIKKSLLVTSLVLAFGLMASHAMVPPTPGPIAATGILQADFGLVIFWGIVVSLSGLIPGVIYAQLYGKKVYIEPNPEFTEQELLKKMETAPPSWLTLLPILVPIILIVMKSWNDYQGFITTSLEKELLDFLGTPVISLLIGLGLALFLPKKLEKEMLSDKGWVGTALKDAAIILMITGAGGIFGTVLQKSGIADIIGQSLAQYQLGIWLPFIIAAALKTAQGSSTVAIVTTASLMAPMAAGLGFESEMAKALLVLSIGAGSVVISHANDSFFWIFTQINKIPVAVGYRFYTLGTGLVGLCSALVIYVLSLIML